MAARIIIEANDVWNYLMSHKTELASSMKLIAENQEYGIKIFLACDSHTKYGDSPAIVVAADDDEIRWEPVVDRVDCTDTVKAMYDTYLSQRVVNAFIDEDNERTIAEELEEIDERETELDDAIYECLVAIIPDLFDIVDDPDELCEDLKDHICEYLYTHHEISVYRPMYLEVEDGTDEFVEFPYPEMEVDE